MKKILSLAVVCCLTAVAAMFVACSQNDPDNSGNKAKPDYDKMIGTWTLDSYAEKWVNTDDDLVEKDRTVNSGQLTIAKQKDEDGDYYTYSENFINEDGRTFSGRIEISDNGYIYLNDSDGSLRSDGAPTYDFTVTFPADGKMEWTYNWNGIHSHNGLTHKDKRTALAKFTKQK